MSHGSVHGGTSARPLPLMGGESKCSPGEAPSEPVTILLIFCLVLVVLDAISLTFTSIELAKRPDPPPQNYILSAMSILLHALGFIVFVVRWRKCDGIHGFAVYLALAMMGFVLGFWVRWEERTRRLQEQVQPCTARR